ncbi:MAG: PEP-CTERM sorting domain-containing protein [Phycisphaerae bacterium]
MRNRTLWVCALGALGFASAANAASISFNDSVPVQPTDFTSSVTVSKFNPALGTLNSIDFKIEGAVEGSIRFESLDASPATVSASLAASITLQRPDLSNIVVTTPAFSVMAPLSAYDGVTDFGGTSGATFLGLSGSDTDTFTSPPPASDLALFTGLGNITLPVKATAMSTASGAGNLVALFLTNAGARVMVTYNYTVPEPATLALLSFGGLFFRRRRTA